MTHTDQTALSGLALAVRAERIDTDSWFDQWSGAPAPVVQALELVAARHGELRMVRSVVPFSHFNMVLTLGCPAPADDAALAAVEDFYGERAEVPHWILVNDHTVPTDLPQRLFELGYEAAGQWDRVVLQHAAPERWSSFASGCELVHRQNAPEWAGFIIACYRLLSPAIACRQSSATGWRRWWIGQGGSTLCDARAAARTGRSS